MNITLRASTIHDVPALAQLNHAAYPDLVTAGVVFDEAQLRAQASTFSFGQRVAELDGKIVGAISTLIVDEKRALAPHTWIDITGYGCFATHDNAGNALYLADIYVHPDAWGRGVGPALYEELRSICRARGLKRIVAGGRLWGYHEVASAMTPEQYVSEVLRGERRDRVLSSQLRAGFTVQRVMPGYLEDWRSAGFATLLDWPNPDVIASATRPEVTLEPRA